MYRVDKLLDMFIYLYHIPSKPIAVERKHRVRRQFKERELRTFRARKPWLNIAP
jgi:hypothetical protein